MTTREGIERRPNGQRSHSDPVGRTLRCDWCGARRVVSFVGDVQLRGRAERMRLCGPCVRRDAVVLGVSHDFSRPVQGVLL